MTVFRGYLMIIRRNCALLLLYVGIFIGICVMAQQSGIGTGMTEGFAAVKLNVAVIDREHGVLGEVLRAVMERDQNLVKLADDSQILQEELYYRNVEYILVIPEGAEQRLEAGEEAVVQSIMAPDSTAGYYVESQVQLLLGQIRTYLAGGFALQEAADRALALGELSGEVTLLNLNGTGGARPDYNFFFRYLPYAFLGAVVITMSTVIMEFKKKAVQRRMLSSSVPFIRQNLAAVASFLLVGGVVWAICIALQAVFYRGGIFAGMHTGYYLLNSGALMLVALSLGYLSGMLSNSPAGLNGLTNVISLGLCFLGGVFVPLEMLGSKMKLVAQFLPTYWYSRINDILGDYGTVSGELSAVVWKGILIQLLFAAACFAVTLAVKRGILSMRDQ